MNGRVRGFTLIELIMVITIIGILAVIAIPRFINLRVDAQNAAAEGNIGAMRGAISIYYARSATDQYSYLCQACGSVTPCNSLRTVTVSAPCFPANTADLEAQLSSPPQWYDPYNNTCYNSTTQALSSCY